MKKRTWYVVFLPALLLIFFTSTAFTLAPSTYTSSHASLKSQNVKAPDCLPTSSYVPGCSQCPSAGTYYRWNYTGNSRVKVPNGQIDAAQETNHAVFTYDGRCSIPSVTSYSCQYPPRAFVESHAADCFIETVGDQRYLIQDSNVVYMGFTLCTLHTELGSDPYGDYLTYESDNCPHYKQGGINHFR